MHAVNPGAPAAHLNSAQACWSGRQLNNVLRNFTMFRCKRCPVTSTPQLGCVSRASRSIWPRTTADFTAPPVREESRNRRALKFFCLVLLVNRFKKSEKHNKVGSQVQRGCAPGHHFNVPSHRRAVQCRGDEAYITYSSSFYRSAINGSGPSRLALGPVTRHFRQLDCWQLDREPIWLRLFKHQEQLCKLRLGR